MQTTTRRPRSRERSPLARTIALMLIAGTLGAWAAFLFLSWDHNVDHQTRAAPQHHAQPARDESPTVADIEHQHEGEMGMAVVAMMAADPISVTACIGSSLEPFDGALTQLRAAGPGEAAERMRSCVFDSIVGHGDDTTMADLESRRQSFEQCFGQLADAEPADKARAVELVSACVFDELPSS